MSQPTYNRLQLQFRCTLSIGQTPDLPNKNYINLLGGTILSRFLVQKRYVGLLVASVCVSSSAVG